MKFKLFLSTCKTLLNNNYDNHLPHILLIVIKKQECNEKTFQFKI